MSPARPRLRTRIAFVALAAFAAAFACEGEPAGYAAHTCALLDDGAVWCWGYNRHGELGDGTAFDRAAPAPVNGLPPARDVSAGEAFTCAASSDGRSYCWGRNDHGELGDASVADRSTPGLVPGAERVQRVFAGPRAACALVEGGDVWCWGALGRTAHRVAARITDLPGPSVDVAVGSDSACAAVADGSVWCWGDALVASRGAITGAAAVTFWGDEPCALLRDQTVTCVGLPSPAVALAGRDAHGCALLANGDVSCWGNDAFRKPEMFGEPEPFGATTFASEAIAVAVGSRYACAVTGNGAVQCWGDNWAGQLGDGTDRTRAAAVTVRGLPGAARAVTASPGAQAWDSGRCGQSATPDDR